MTSTDATDSTGPARQLSQTGRIEAFSDGVMAIAITLLVLDLKVPSAAEVSDSGSLLGALLDRWPSYLAYLAAFLTIGIIWLNHRAFVDRIIRFDARMQWLNLALLPLRRAMEPALPRPAALAWEPAPWRWLNSPISSAPAARRWRRCLPIWPRPMR